MLFYALLCEKYILLLLYWETISIDLIIGLLLALCRKGNDPPQWIRSLNLEIGNDALNMDYALVTVFAKLIKFAVTDEPRSIYGCWLAYLPLYPYLPVHQLVIWPTRSTCGDAKLTPRTVRGAGIARPYITTYIRASGMRKQDHPSIC